MTASKEATIKPRTLMKNQSWTTPATGVDGTIDDGNYGVFLNTMHSHPFRNCIATSLSMPSVIKERCKSYLSKYLGNNKKKKKHVFCPQQIKFSPSSSADYEMKENLIG